MVGPGQSPQVHIRPRDGLDGWSLASRNAGCHVVTSARFVVVVPGGLGLVCVFFQGAEKGRDFADRRAGAEQERRDNRRGLMRSNASENCFFAAICTDTMKTQVPFSGTKIRTRREFGRSPA